MKTDRQLAKAAAETETEVVSQRVSLLLLHVASEAQLSSAAAAALVLPTTVVAAAVAVASCVVRISGKNQTLH